ncbi:MAG: cell division protein ZipA [Legionella sp.]|nr:MAG: cell division protein ZipA [Legionella sp.]
MTWSLMLNVFLLAGVVIAIVRTMRARRQQDVKKTAPNPTLSPSQSNFYDDIVAVRKVNDDEPLVLKPILSPPLRQPLHTSSPKILKSDKILKSEEAQPTLRPVIASSEAVETVLPKKEDTVTASIAQAPSVMMFLLAKSNRQLAGYELLQAVLSAGFRFGEGDLFHRHQYQNGQGPIMCTLAAATPTGVFDLQNIGGFVVHGLCLFMQSSGHSETDAERFDILMDSAKTLSDSLDTHLLDDRRAPLSEQSITRYHQQLMLTEDSLLIE